MKLTKQSLRQMIREATVLNRDALTKGQHAQKSTEQAKIIRAQSANKLSNKERSLIQQIEGILTEIAEYEGVDLEDFRTQLNAVLVRLKNATGAKLAGDESEEIQEL